MVKHRRRRARSTRGAAAVEFALVVPIFLILFFGIVQFSLYFWASQTGTSAANAAVRKLAVGDCQSGGALTDFVKSRLGSVNQGNLTVTRTYTDPSGAAVLDPSPPTSTLPATAVGGTVTLSVSFKTLDLHLPVPFLNNSTFSKSFKARIEDNSQDSACS